MSQTPKGAKKAAATMKKRYGKQFFSDIGKLGGARMHGPDSKGGFQNMSPEKRSEAGRLGGSRKRTEYKKRVSA